MNTAGFVTMGAAYAATHFLGQGLDKITLGVVDLSTIKGWIASDLKEEVERRAVDAAFDVMLEAGEGTMVSFLKKLCVPENVAEGAVGGFKDIKEELGTETTVKAGLMIVEGVKGAVVGGVSAAGTGALAGLAGGPGGVVGGAVMSGVAGGVVGGAKGVLLVSAATPEEASALKNALQASGIKWVLTEFATYMKTHGEGGRKQMGNIINKSLSGYTILSDDFCWGAGKQLRKFVTGTIVFLIKHMVVEKYYSDDPAARRRAMYYRLGIAAVGHSQGLVNLMSSSISYSKGILGGLMESPDRDEYKMEDTLEHRYSFVINEALVMDAKKRTEELDAEAKDIKKSIEGLKAELSHASMARMSEVDYIDQHFGALGEKITGNDRSAYNKHSQHLEALNKKERELAENISKEEQALRVIEDKKISAEILAPCSVSYKEVRNAKEALAIQVNIRESADFMLEQNSMRLQYLQTSTYLDDVKEEITALRSNLKLIQEELRNNDELSEEESAAYLTRERDTIHQIIKNEAHVQHLEAWVKTDVLKSDGTHNDHGKLRDAIDESNENYESLKADAKKAIPGLEKAVKKADAQFEKDKSAAIGRALDHTTTLAQTPVGEAKKLIRLGMLYHDGHITKGQYNEAISSIHTKIEALPDGDPRKAGCAKAIERFTLENLFPVGYRNTSTEEDKDGKLTIHVFNTEIESFKSEVQAAAKASVNESVQSTLSDEIAGAVSVYGFNTNFSVDPQFLSDINDGSIKLEVSAPKSEVHQARDAMGMDTLDDNELLAEKLFVASNYDAATVSKITQLITQESAKAMLAPLIDSLKQGNDETGLGTEIVPADIDNPDYICQVSETDTGVLITFTAKWDVVGHTTGDRSRKIDNKAGESSVEASVTVHLTPGEARKERVEVKQEDLRKDQGIVGSTVGAAYSAVGSVAGWFGLGSKPVEAPAGPIYKIITVQDAPKADMRACALVRTVRDTLEIENN